MKKKLITIIENLFEVCCQFIYWIGQTTGMGYELTNLLIFVIIHPLITLTFFILWRKAKNQQQKFKELAQHHYANRTRKS